MSKRKVCAIAIVPLLALLFETPFNSVKAEQSDRVDIAWQSWSDSAFEKAQRENKPVILDLEAVWCHWCHVMDHETYGNPAIAKLLKEHFVTLKVDQDSRPDLSSRYQEYGWPATI